MSISKSVILRFVYCYRENIVKHIVNNSFGNISSVNNVYKSDYSTNISGYENEPRQKCGTGGFNFVKFEDKLEERRNVANRSYIVQVNSESSCSELYEYCQNISTVEQMYYYHVKGNHFVLVEFADVKALDNLFLESSTHSVKSPFVWFRTGKKMNKGHSNSGMPLSLVGDLQAPSKQQIIEWMTAAQSLSDEMEILYQTTKLSELGVKLRMICAKQVEMVLSGLFPNVKAIPFGSTVNSFGKEGCDLDIVLRYNFSQESSRDIRLVYQSKINGISSRGQTQRQMELLGDILQIHVPGVTGVKRILGARVPIIKYSHEYTGVDVDISVTNLSAVYMSELLYLFANMDPVVQRIVFSIKAWAKAVGLTNPTPGRWITNFSLTLLVIFYFQTEKRLPSIDDLFRLAGPDDKIYAEEINCSFVRDLRSINLSLDQSKSAADLLLGFFNFYQRFDFKNQGINLCTAKAISKPDFSPIYIVNPLDRNLNVSKNVSIEEAEQLLIETRNAAWTLETGSSLSEIIQKSPESLLSKRKYVSRMVAVKDLFQT